MSKKRDVSRETLEDAVKEGQAPRKDGGGKGKTTPVFVYLAVLFAAAFIMLLLAYFVQQRSSENAMDDLRTSMTATREELMEQNRQLQEEKEELQASLDALHDQLHKVTGERDEYEQEAQRWKDEAEQYSTWENSYGFLLSFWAVEEHYVKGDYAACAEAFKEWYSYRVPPEVLERAEEIRDELTRRGLLEKDEYGLSK